LRIFSRIRKKFDPDRYSEVLGDAKLSVGIPSARQTQNACGNAFAMLQLESLFSILLRDIFSMIDDKDHYQDDFTKMVVQPKITSAVFVI